MRHLRRLAQAIRGTRRRPWQRNSPRWFFVLLAVLVAGLVVGGAYSRVEALRRTEAADVTIESMAFQPGRGPYPHTPQGHHLRYSYEVRGNRYQGSTFRRWTNIEWYRPKVCYNPEQPSDHILVPGWYRCGTWPVTRNL